MNSVILAEPLLLVLKATILLGMGGLLTVATRRSPAAVRHLVWSATLIALLALPLLSVGLPRWTLAVLPAGLASEAAVAVAMPLPPEPPVLADGFAGAALAAETPAAMPAPVSAPAAVLPVAAGSAAPRDWPQTLLRVWAAGTLLVLGWIVVGLVGVRRLRRRAQPVRDPEWLSEAYDAAWLLDITRPVTLLRGDRTATPMTWGMVWPTVLLPEAAEEWSPERRRMVLLHELAHVRRKDCLTQLVAHLACALFWFHPLVWYAARQLRVERERACDDLVVRSGASAADYADHLLQVARTLRVPRAAAAIAMARPSQLEGRLLAVLDSRRRREDPPIVTRLGAILVIALLAVPLAALQPAAASAAASADSGLDDAPVWAETDAPDGPETVGDADETPAADGDAEIARWFSGEAVEAGQELRWEGAVRRGGTLAIYHWNGPIQASGTTAGRASVVGERRALDRNQREVHIQTVEHAGGTTVCVVPEGARCTADGIRDDNRGRNEGSRQVALTVLVPEGIALRTETMNGALRLEDIRSDVSALTMNGAIRASATGTVQAKTMNGSITVAMGRTDWRGSLDLETMNGAIHVTLPDDASTEVSARTMSGGIRSDFPLSISRRTAAHSASGTIGAGGRSLKLTSMNGSINIRRVGGPLPGQASTSAAPQRPPRPPRPARAERADSSDDVVINLGAEDWDGFSRSIEAIAESAADLGVGIAESVVGSVVAAFGGNAERNTRREPAEVHVRRLRTAEDAEVRRIAAWALYRARGEGTDALAEALLSDPDAKVREMAAWSLGMLRNEGSARALRLALANDRDSEVRGSALWALERIGPSAVAPAIPTALADRSEKIRKRAAWWVGDQRHRDGLTPLAQALRDRDREVRVAAAWSLGRLGDARALPHLERALDDASPEVRKAALWAATRIDHEDASRLLDKASADRSSEVRNLAIGQMKGHPWPWPWPWPEPRPRPAP
jgi:beta-lactamase regulating signal transducer with metallopeptidase domain/HEAT repeat protein